MGDGGAREHRQGEARALGFAFVAEVLFLELRV